jgi:hypothetical protein
MQRWLNIRHRHRLRSSLPIFGGGSKTKVSIKGVDDGREVRVYFETVEFGFVHCQIANYVNCKSNLAFVQVFPDGDSLVLRTKASSSISRGGANEDFSNIAYSSLLTAYENWFLFEVLYSTDLSAKEIIERASQDA